jgi:hypothetical protein
MRVCSHQTTSRCSSIFCVPFCFQCRFVYKHPPKGPKKGGRDKKIVLLIQRPASPTSPKCNFENSQMEMTRGKEEWKKNICESTSNAALRRTILEPAPSPSTLPIRCLFSLLFFYCLLFYSEENSAGIHKFDCYNCIYSQRLQ